MRPLRLMSRVTYADRAIAGAATATAQASEPPRLVVVGNWIAELKRKLGAPK